MPCAASPSRSQLRCEEETGGWTTIFARYSTISTPRDSGTTRRSLTVLDGGATWSRKRDCAPLLESALPRVPSGALVLAHDVTHPDYHGHLGAYRELVADRRRFRRTATIEVDPCDLEVTVV